jgi:copper transport protein
MSGRVWQACVRLVAAAVIVFGVVIGTATAAAAHANLVSTTPAQSAHFRSGAPPGTVTVRFDDNVTVTPASVAVYDHQGRPLHVATHQPADHTIVTSSLPRLADGTYVVVWHIVSDDGHPEQGAFTFSVGATSASTVNIANLVASRSSSHAVGVAFGIDRALAYLACLVLVGGLMFLRWCWPDALRGRHRRVLLLGAAAALAATLISIPLQAAYSNGRGTSLLDSSAMSDVIHARFGRAALIRATLVVVLVACAFVRSRGPARVVTEGVVAVAGIGLFATFAYAGHADTGRWRTLGFVTDITHLGAAAIWLGGVSMLVVAAFDADSRPAATLAARRFSRLALPAVLVVVFSGVVQAWRQTGSWNALWHTSYSRLLVLKVLVVLAIVLAASAARASLRDRTDDRADHRALPEIRASVLIEAVLAVVVLAVTSTLVVSRPAREAVAAGRVPTPRTLYLAADGTTVGYQVVVQPALVGENTFVVTPRLLHATGYLPVALNGTLHGSGPDGTSAITFLPLTDGRWIATASLAKAGRWSVDLNGDTAPAVDRATLAFSLK